MKNSYNTATSNRTSPFTLVEIMVVVVIIGIIIGITVPVFNSIATRKSVDAAASMIASAFRLARAEAAQRRTVVGIAFYIEDGTTHSGASFRAKWVNPVSSAEEFFPNSSRQFLPAGSLVELTHGNAGDWISVYYKSSGRLQNSETVIIREAVLDQNGTRRMLNPDNFSRIQVNQYTGNVTVESSPAP